MRGTVCVVVHGADGLRAADSGLLGSTKSDPYVVVAIGDEQQCTKTAYAFQKGCAAWEEAFSFNHGLENSASGNPLPDTAEFAVYYSDTLSRDAVVGLAEFQLDSVFEQPRTWMHMDIDLVACKTTGGHLVAAMEAKVVAPAEASSTSTLRSSPESLLSSSQDLPGASPSGSIACSILWEPVPRMCTSYTLRVLCMTCFLGAGTLAMISASCPWQRPAMTAGDAIRQPGVTMCLLLASCACQAGAVLHLLLAHIARPLDRRSLSNYGRQKELGELLRSFPSGDNVVANHIDNSASVKLSIIPRGLTNYEAVIAPAFDMRVPLTLLAWFTPGASIGLIGVAAGLQLGQDGGRLTLQSGEMLAVAAVLHTCFGYVILFALEAVRPIPGVKRCKPQKFQTRALTVPPDMLATRTSSRAQFASRTLRLLVGSVVFLSCCTSQSAGHSGMARSSYVLACFVRSPHSSLDNKFPRNILYNKRIAQRRVP